jgi:hypothetical protein
MTTRYCYALKILLPAFLFILLAGGYGWSQQEKSDRDRPFVLSFPHEIDATKLWINYMITGTFGGYGSFIQTRSGVWDYSIETTYGNHPAETLKVIIYIPGYQAQTMDLSSRINTPQRNIEVHLLPLATVPFSGRVLALPNTDLEGLTLNVTYAPNWLCEFFNLPDCMISFLPINSVTLDKDGRFTVVLPDFAHDQTVSSFKWRGSFGFTIWNMKGGERLFSLKPKDEKYGKMGVDEADKYPDQVIFELGPR